MLRKGFQLPVDIIFAHDWNIVGMSVEHDLFILPAKVIN